MNPGDGIDVHNETRLERRLDTAVDRATTPRGAAIVIAGASIVLTVASALPTEPALRMTGVTSSLAG